MAIYSSLNLFFIKLFTILVPRFLCPPFALFWGGLFYLLLPGARRSIRANVRVVTGRERVERLAGGNANDPARSGESLGNRSGTAHPRVNRIGV